jgi:hypothetical protein
MRIALLLLAMSVSLLACGCYTRDMTHNRHHMHAMEDDLSAIHADMDMLYD